jgi:methylisocitrate lyase
VTSAGLPAGQAGRRLRDLMKRGALAVPGVYDALTALLAQKTGFQAGYVSGAGLSVSLHGQPDIGLLTLSEVAATVRRLARATPLPLIVDADTGYGGEPNVERAVRELEGAGAAGLQIEDQVFPKRCGHLSGKTVVRPEEMVAKVKAAVRARRDKNFVIVARTDARAVTGFKDALRRAEMYRKAGADVIFPEALETIEEFRAFGRKKSLGALMANMTEFGRSPILSVPELARLGYRLVLFPMTAFRTAAFAVQQSLQELKLKGHNRTLLGRMQTRRELYELNHYQDFDRREGRYLSEAASVVRRLKK